MPFNISIKPIDVTVVETVLSKPDRVSLRNERDAGSIKTVEKPACS